MSSGSSRGHASTIDEYWNYSDVSLDGSRDLRPDVIIRLVKPAVAVLAFSVKPVVTDDAKKYFAIRKLPLKLLYKINRGRNVIDIHENIVFAKSLCKSIVDPPRRAGGIIAAIVDKNPTGHGTRALRKTIFTRSSFALGTTGPAYPADSLRHRWPPDAGTRRCGSRRSGCARRARVCCQASSAGQGVLVASVA